MLTISVGILTDRGGHLEMITMRKKQKIVLEHFRDGETKSEIARRLNLNWRTVDKYISEYQLALEKVQVATSEKELPLLISSIVERPRYDISTRKKRKINAEIIKEVTECLSENEKKKKLRQHKQVMKKIDIYEYLQEKGFNIGYSTVASLVNELESKGKEAFIRQEYFPGEICEFDWGEVKIKIKGKLEKFYIAVFTAAYSNFRFSVLFSRQDTQAFQQSHALFFSFIEGNYLTMVYDNMKVAVKRFVGRFEKEATDGLLKLSTYYTFDFRFCNIAKGNEKGHVERSVEYIRRKTFCRHDSFNSLEEANEHLKQKCIVLNTRPQKDKNGASAEDLFIAEKEVFRPALPPFESALLLCHKVDTYSTIIVSQNRYSVPDKFVGKMIDIRAYSDHIVCYFEGKEIARHPRTYMQHCWTISLEHYLKTLLRKPGAFKGSIAFSQAEKIVKEIYKTHFIGREKEFITLLLYQKEKRISFKYIDNIIHHLLQQSNKDITTDKIKILYEQQQATSKESASNTTDEITQKSMQSLEEHSELVGKWEVRTCR